MFALGCVFTLGCVLVTLVGPSGCATQMDFSDAKVAAQLPEPLLDSSQRTRFAVVGDIGVDDDGMQRAIAFRVRALCEAAETRCDFILANGDNLYPSGFADHNAASRLRRLLDNYGPTPKYLVLGNHDYHPVIHDLDVAL